MLQYIWVSWFIVALLCMTIDLVKSKKGFLCFMVSGIVAGIVGLVGLEILIQAAVFAGLGIIILILFKIRRKKKKLPLRYDVRRILRRKLVLEQDTSYENPYRVILENESDIEWAIVPTSNKKVLSAGDVVKVVDCRGCSLGVKKLKLRTNARKRKIRRGEKAVINAQKKELLLAKKQEKLAKKQVRIAEKSAKKLQLKKLKVEKKIAKRSRKLEAKKLKIENKNLKRNSKIQKKATKFANKIEKDKLKLSKKEAKLNLKKEKKAAKLTKKAGRESIKEQKRALKGKKKAQKVFNKQAKKKAKADRKYNKRQDKINAKESAKQSKLQAKEDKANKKLLQAEYDKALKEAKAQSEVVIKETEKVVEVKETEKTVEVKEEVPASVVEEVGASDSEIKDGMVAFNRNKKLTFEESMKEADKSVRNAVNEVIDYCKSLNKLKIYSSFFKVKFKKAKFEIIEIAFKKDVPICKIMTGSSAFKSYYKDSDIKIKERPTEVQLSAESVETVKELVDIVYNDVMSMK